MWSSYMKHLLGTLKYAAEAHSASNAASGSRKLLVWRLNAIPKLVAFQPARVETDSQRQQPNFDVATNLEYRLLEQIPSEILL
jgi:hypothetical protein